MRSEESTDRVYQSLAPTPRDRRVLSAVKTAYKYVFALCLGVIIGWQRSNYWTRQLVEEYNLDVISAPVAMVPDHYLLALLPGLYFGVKRISHLYGELKESITLIDAVKFIAWSLGSLLLALLAIVFLADAILWVMP